MTTQNDWLTNYFGDDVAEDLEKTAQAHLLVKLAEGAGLDINQLSEEELQALAAELMQELQGQGAQPGAPGQQLPSQMPGMQPNPLAQFGQPTQQRPPQQLAQAPQGHPGMGAPGGGTGGLSPEMAKEAQAKFEEADALGRVMAHAYVEELDKIAAVRETEKTAGFRDAAKSVGSRAKSMAQNASWKAKGVAENAGWHARRGARNAGDAIKRNKGVIGAAAGGAAAGFAGGRASKKEKNASAFEKLATDRAVEILQTLGIDPQTGEPMQDLSQPEQGFEGQDQVQVNPDQQFDGAIDQRALQLLGEAGYDQNAVAQAYDQTVGAQPQQ